MAYTTARYRMTGAAPLIMHSGKLINPRDEDAKKIKELSEKRSKSDADYERMAEIEYKASLYLLDGQGPVLPGKSIEAMLTEAARKTRLAPLVKAGVIVEGAAPIEYDGPRDPDGLWQDERFQLISAVRVMNKRIMRARPCFRCPWSALIEVQYLKDVINLAKLTGIIKLAGEQVGIGDWRPRYGRFSISQP